MKKQILILLFLSSQIFAQQGGMWVPSLLTRMNEKEMKNLGSKLSTKDIYDYNHSSLKDAVPHFDGGCTSSVISDKGLLLTNHHCGFDNIQFHSSVEHDYLTDGFWAKKLEEELPNPGLTVTFVVRIEDVTNRVLANTEKLTFEEKAIQIQENIKEITAKFKKEDYQDISIKSFYHDNQYLLFVNETYKDVRLVGAPPSSIGKFGSDTDNWMWPRHTGDFSLFRIYADANNKPAEYSKDNVPYKPKHFLPINIGGIKENDFTLVMGYPGRTQEYLPSVAVEQIVNTLNPIKIEIRDKALKVMDEFMREDKAIKIQYAAKYASIANYWKKWIGENQGLQKAKVFSTKKKAEKQFLNRLSRIKKRKIYGRLFYDFEDYYAEIQPYSLSREIFTEVALRNNELLQVSYKLFQLENVLKTKGEQAFTDRKNNLIKAQELFYKDYNATVDEKIFEQLIAVYALKTPQEYVPTMFKNLKFQQLTPEIYKTSKLTSYNGFKELLNGTPQEIIQKMNADKGYATLKAMATMYLENVNPRFEEINKKITMTQHLYTQALLEVSKKYKTRMFPDANSTLRITYGKARGYKPVDAIRFETFTYLEGVIQKYKPNDYEFDVPQKLLDLFRYKDYGPYSEKGKIPVCFVGTNHTTGGNSGSPVMDKKGNLIGLNFDRVWEGTMSDIYYDPSICRNIMVDIRYVLFIVDKFADAKHLIREMNILR